MKTAVTKRIAVEASYPAPGRLNLAFSPPIQTWRFPTHEREQAGRAAALDVCREAVRRQWAGGGEDAPVAQIKAAVEAALEVLVGNGTIALPQPPADLTPERPASRNKARSDARNG